MSELTDQLKETNQLLSALHLTKQKKRKMAHRSKNNFSRIDKRKKKARVRKLPVILTRTAVITLLLVCVVIVIGGMEYLGEEEANAVISKKQQIKKEASVQKIQFDDRQLLDVLSKK